MPEFRFDHVGIAVHAIKPALKLYRDGLGGEYLMGGDQAGSWRWLQLRYPGGGKVELLEPLGEGFLSKFLDSRGEGLHRRASHRPRRWLSYLHFCTCGIYALRESVR